MALRNTPAGQGLVFQISHTTQPSAKPGGLFFRSKSCSRRAPRLGSTLTHSFPPGHRLDRSVPPPADVTHAPPAARLSAMYSAASASQDQKPTHTSTHRHAALRHAPPFNAALYGRPLLLLLTTTRWPLPPRKPLRRNPRNLHPHAAKAKRHAPPQSPKPGRQGGQPWLPARTQRTAAHPSRAHALITRHLYRASTRPQSVSMHTHTCSTAIVRGRPTFSTDRTCHAPFIAPESPARLAGSTRPHGAEENAPPLKRSGRNHTLSSRGRCTGKGRQQRLACRGSRRGQRQPCFLLSSGIHACNSHLSARTKRGSTLLGWAEISPPLAGAHARRSASPLTPGHAGIKEKGERCERHLCAVRTGGKGGGRAQQARVCVRPRREERSTCGLKKGRPRSPRRTQSRGRCQKLPPMALRAAHAARQRGHGAATHRRRLHLSSRQQRQRKCTAPWIKSRQQRTPAHFPSRCAVLRRHVPWRAGAGAGRGGVH